MVIIIIMDKIGKGKYWKYLFKKSNIRRIISVEKILFKVVLEFMVFSKMVCGGVI